MSRNTQPNGSYQKWVNERGTSGRSEYWDHDFLEMWAKDAKSKQRYWTKIGAGIGVLAAGGLALACGNPAAPITCPAAIAGVAKGSVLLTVSSAAGGLIGTVSSEVWNDQIKNWIEKSAMNDYCGIELEIWYDIFGKGHVSNYYPQ